MSRKLKKIHSLIDFAEISAGVFILVFLCWSFYLSGEPVDEAARKLANKLFFITAIVVAVLGFLFFLYYKFIRNSKWLYHLEKDDFMKRKKILDTRFEKKFSDLDCLISIGLANEQDYYDLGQKYEREVTRLLQEYVTLEEHLTSF